MDVATQKAFIADSRDSINFYARSIGAWKQLKAKEEDDKNFQWFHYFMLLDEIDMEEEVERLEKLRTELVDYERGQRELCAV